MADGVDEEDGLRVGPAAGGEDLDGIEADDDEEVGLVDEGALGGDTAEGAGGEGVLLRQRALGGEGGEDGGAELLGEGHEGGLGDGAGAVDLEADDDGGPLGLLDGADGGLDAGCAGAGTGGEASSVASRRERRRSAPRRA